MTIRTQPLEADRSVGPPRIGYVVKRYPRFSETFIVNELLAHQAAGAEVEIFALRPPNDTHFQDAIARVKSPVCYLAHAGLKAKDVWETMRKFDQQLDRLTSGLAAAWDADIVDVHQAMLLAQEVKARSIGHLHAHFASSPTTVARLAARFAGIGFSFTAHAKDIFHEDVVSGELTAKLSDAAAVVTVSDYNARHLRRLAGDAAPNIVRIYNGIDLDAFGFHSPVDRPPLVVGVGRLVEKKGFEDLIEACALMSKDGRRFRCRIIGAGPLEQTLRRQVEALRLSDRVTLTGPLPQQEMRREVRGAAVLAAPCVVGKDGNRDGMPTTLLEAMALGTPCVSTDVTGIPEAVRHDETGLIVPQRDPKRLADALLGLLDRPQLRERLAVNARRMIEAEFDVSKSAGRLRAVFAAIAAEHAALRAF
ncbi:MAG: glycosyltransferase [Deltaproteobacteria bacterium]|nr:glycosyltransferase [Deltaproteobacteria bacterium]MBW2387508.1 glycosyltransferase [Deltaproteobacteria bacterium]